MITNPQEVTVYFDKRYRVGFAASDPAMVMAIEQVFPGGEWQDDEDARPIYFVPGLKIGSMRPITLDGEDTL